MRIGGRMVRERGGEVVGSYIAPHLDPTPPAGRLARPPETPHA